ncbi:WecB/TagA/CpsF family glycosyltransferase [Gammaproteobacteria bacterium]|nr:WecB/TagA/CpsF family glycosyltransferase [Gammaproteobacteria bacterium]
MSIEQHSSTNFDSSASLLLGIPVDNVDIDEAVRLIDQMVNTYKQDKRARYVATVNVDFLVKAISILPNRARDHEMLNILRKSDLVTADGAPLVLLSKLTGQPLKQRVAGADLVPAIAEKAAAAGHRIFLLGADESTAAQAAYALRSKYPKLKIVGTASPLVHITGNEMIHAAERDRTIVAQINTTRPDILLLAFGNPKQEIWFERNRFKLHVPVSIGIGGTLSFIAGTIKRAPRWMQASGLEWIYRVIQEPGRLWKRYAEGLFKFSLMALPALLLTLVTIGKRPVGQGATRYQKLTTDQSDTVYHLRLPRCVEVSTVSDLISFCKQQASRNMIFDFADVERIEASALAPLTRLLSFLLEHGAQKYLCGISWQLKQSLSMVRALTGWDTSCSSESFSEILHGRFRAAPGTCIWRAERGGAQLQDIYPQGDLVNTSLADDPFGFRVPTSQFRPLSIHFDGVGKVDNAALLYLLDGIRRHGARNISITDPQKKLLSPRSVELAAAEAPTRQSPPARTLTMEPVVHPRLAGAG